MESVELPGRDLVRVAPARSMHETPDGGGQCVGGNSRSQLKSVEWNTEYLALMGTLNFEKEILTITRFCPIGVKVYGRNKYGLVLALTLSSRPFMPSN